LKVLLLKRNSIFWTSNIPNTMCRFTFVVKDEKLSLEEIKGILWFYDNSIFKQSYKNPYTPKEDINPRNNHLNLDGYGIGWYADSTPIVYRNVIPSWNDVNLMHLLPSIRTKSLLAHIRAVVPLSKDSKFKKYVSHIPVNTYNCHPFQYKDIMFCHNGTIESFYDGSLRKKIINKISNNLITEIKGNTDSEYLFFLILSFIENGNSPNQAIVSSFLFLNSLSDTNICSLNIYLNINNISYITRYINSNEHQPPSLYLSTCKNRTIITSEPLNTKECEWDVVENNSLITINNTTRNYTIKHLF